MNSQSAQECIQKFQGKRVAVIGDLMLDVYVKGSASRISPEAPVPVLHVRSVSSCLGGAANVMRNLVTLGAKVSAFGTVGDDVSGRKIIAELQDYGINSEYVLKDPDRPTTEKQRVIAGQQQIVRIDFEELFPLSEQVRNELVAGLIQKINEGQFDAVIIEDYAKGLLSQEMFDAVVLAANANGLVIALDPHPKQHFKVKGLTVMTPNRGEAFGLAGLEQTEPIDPAESDPHLLAVAEKVKADWSCDNLLITLGAQGMALYANDGGCKIIPTRAREVYDVSGAGDTVIASFTLALLAGETPEYATIFSNHAAGVVVGKHGTVAVLPEEIIKSFKEGL